MDLFIVNRYWSEDQTKDEVKNAENDLLEVLKEKVSAKKKSRDIPAFNTQTKKIKLDDEAPQLKETENVQDSDLVGG